jgi:hypothetical protein
MAGPPAAHQKQTELLQDRLISLAGTPDDSSRIETDLIVIAQLAADRIAAVRYASITSRYEGAYATVAASSDLIVAVDQAQYGDNAGPCLDALDGGYPAAVPDIAATMTWPGFRDTAFRLGLRASLSIPLFAGSGKTIAALNLYSPDAGTMKDLAAAVWATFDPDDADAPHLELDPGGRELIAGLIGALALRGTIQRALGVIMAATGHTADRAYLTLRTQAAGSKRSLAVAAADLIAHQKK